MVELGHIDIGTEVSHLSAHLAFPCEGHLETALHIMSNLSQKQYSRLIFDPTYPKIDMGQFPQYNLTEFCGNVEEAFPVDMSKPLGKDVDVCMMCERDHARDKRTRCSCTGFLIFCYMALIDCVSKNTRNHWDFSLWWWICCYETRNWKAGRSLHQALHDGDPINWALLYIRWQ